MLRCIQLAKNGLGTTYPNPLVGCVIVHKNKIIGEGWHYKAGQPHAEVNAIAHVTHKNDLKEATLYVSLEPCNHFGATPPCSELIISSGIKRIVIGSKDPNPRVNGSGILKLKEAGCEVIHGILSELCDDLNKRFNTYHQKKRPYIILKWAQTKDGFIAPQDSQRSIKKKPIWISNEYSRQWVHKLRSMEQAILVGTKTVLMDNPSLTVRDWNGSSPIRIVIDRNLDIPINASVFDENSMTILLTEKEATNKDHLFYEKICFKENFIEQVCDILHRHTIQSVIVEGGATTLQSFIDANCWDESFVFISEMKLNTGISAPQFSGKLVSKENLKGDILHHYKNSGL
jgi:diaminohydroxyphosphoribosylaminopyrimidine deaminase/5-amino-6-(5-phosphoribosylamino)uracil reductase